MQPFIIGIDPGALSGAYAVLDGMGQLAAVDDLPTIADKKTRWVDAMQFVASISRHRGAHRMIAIVERQSARPGQGVASTFVSATAYGSLLACLQIAGCSIEFVTPSAWKAACGLDSDKQVSLDRARLLFPEADLARKKDHGRAEALLIAYYRYYRVSGENKKKSE